MASTALPALSIHTEGESPINLLAKAEQIKSAQQSQEMGSIQLQEARVAQQSRQTLQALFAKNGGDMNQTFADAQQSGKVTPSDLFNFRTQSIAIQTAAAKLSEQQLANIDKEHGLIANGLEEIKALPVAQRTPQAIADIIGRLGQQGLDVSKYMPAIQTLAKDPSDLNVNNLETGFVGAKRIVENERAFREEASAPTVGQAQAKTAADLATAQTNALKAQRELDNMPSPLEAKTSRQAQLLVEQSTAAKNFAETEKTKAETILAKMEPVEGLNPATGRREVTGRQDAANKKLQQVNPLNADQYNKEAMLSTRFGQVAQNLGKYEAAIRQASPVKNKDDMAQVIADQALGNNPGLLHIVPSGGLVTTKEVSKATADAWNHLTPDERKLAQAYLQVKGGIITYNKAVDDTGRANETALSLEAANIPTPLEEKHVALDRIKGNKDNIRTIIPAVPHFEHLRDPNDYLKEGENTPVSNGQPVVQAPGQKPLINLGMPDVGLGRAVDQIGQRLAGR